MKISSTNRKIIWSVSIKFIFRDRRRIYFLFFISYPQDSHFFTVKVGIWIFIRRFSHHFILSLNLILFNLILFREQLYFHPQSLNILCRLTIRVRSSRKWIEPLHGKNLLAFPVRRKRENERKKNFERHASCDLLDITCKRQRIVNPKKIIIGSNMNEEWRKCQIMWDSCLFQRAIDLKMDD